MSLGSSNPTTNLTKIKGVDVSVNAGVKDTGTQRVVLATDQTAIPITDNGGSLTVDGTFWQATQPVSVASIPAHAVYGNGANGAAVSGNPVLVAGYDGTNTRTLKTDTAGNLLVNGVQDARSTGSIIAATTVVGPYSVNNRNVTTITISGTYAGVSFIIEATDDGTNWYGLQSINNATGQASSTWTPGTNAFASFDTAVGGYTQIRVRATAWTSGTAVIGVSSQVFAYDPVVAALSQGLAATGTAVVGNPVLIGGSDGTNARNLSTNASGHINIADGGNSITVDGTFWQATQPVSNAGTFAVQAAQSGTWNIGSITTLPALPAGTNAIGKLAANANVVIGGTEAVPSINNTLTNVNTSVYASSLVAKASAGKVYNIVGFNSKVTGQFIQIHNTATLPANGSVPVIIFYVGPLSNFSLDYGVYGKSFATGITICNSSTGPTLTVGAADCWFTAEVI